MSDTKLRCCPFCGGGMKFNKVLTIFICDECNVHIGFPCLYSDEDRFKAVNTRKPIDRIVEKLEEIKMRDFLTIANTGDVKNDFVYENVGNALDKAISIVKGDDENE